MPNGHKDFLAMLQANGRLVEADRYHQCIIKALNNEHDNGEQNGFAVLEGMARVLAQQIAEFDDAQKLGAMNFVGQRAIDLAPEMKSNGVHARTIVEQ